MTVFLVFLVYLAGSRFGRVKLGPDGQVPRATETIAQPTRHVDALAPEDDLDRGYGGQYA